MRDRLLNFLKLILAFALIPSTVFVTISFSKSLIGLTHAMGHFFWLGVLFYMIVHIFIYKPQEIYQFGQRLSSSIMGFYPPLANIGPRIFPIYTLLSLIIFCFVHLFYKKNGYETYFMFLTGFTWAMHIVLTGKELQEENKSTINPNYLFSIQLIYIFIVFLMSTIFTFIVPQFSFASFFYSTVESIKDSYTAIFHQLFIP